MPSIEGADALMLGSVSDLLQEVKILIREIKEGSGIHDDAVPMITYLITSLGQFHTEHSFKIVYNPSQTFIIIYKVTQSFTTVNNR